MAASACRRDMASASTRPENLILSVPALVIEYQALTEASPYQKRRYRCEHELPVGSGEDMHDVRPAEAEKGWQIARFVENSPRVPVAPNPAEPPGEARVDRNEQ